MANLYETIESLCKQKGVRPGRLCADLGLSRGLMTDLKMGRKKGVNADTAQKIAAYLGVSVGYLLGRESVADVLDQVDVAFYGDFKELNEEEKSAVRDMVRIMRQRRKSEG
jgi:DNA-binding Xre family transcriptional regulator